jgi:hypothetical protein
MSAMQAFYESNIAVEQPNPFSLLAQANPQDILTGDLLDWFNW